MDRSAPPPVVYGKGYFFEDYKKQYGKTYLEDFPYLKELAAGRLETIKKLLGPPGAKKTLRLLDIGCAYGPFLAAARDQGFDCLGLDPSLDAVRYVKESLGIPAVQGSFPEMPDALGSGGFDVISLWYVIEHLTAPLRALEAIGGLLRPGGVLALATPSFSGVTGRFKRRLFLNQSPQDHWIIWEPSMMKELLASHNMDLKKIKIIGHHPERFPLIGKRAGTGPLSGFVKTLSVLFGLGDGFEAYAKKRSGL
jgi:SAM-dependent methyltransferase